MNPQSPPAGVSRTLHTIQRVREHSRRESHTRLRRAEALRDEQQARADAVGRELEVAAAARDPGDLTAITSWCAFRLRMELVARREEARLAQRERDLAAARNVHEGRVREELAVQGAVEAAAERHREAERHAEVRALDEIGARTRRSA